MRYIYWCIVYIVVCLLSGCSSPTPEAEDPFPLRGLSPEPGFINPDNNKISVDAKIVRDAGDLSLFTYTIYVRNNTKDTYIVSLAIELTTENGTIHQERTVKVLPFKTVTVASFGKHTGSNVSIRVTTTYVEEVAYLEI